MSLAYNCRLCYSYPYTPYNRGEKPGNSGQGTGPFMPNRYHMWIRHLVDKDHQHNVISKYCSTGIRQLKKETILEDDRYIIVGLPIKMGGTELFKLAIWISEFGVLAAILYLPSDGLCKCTVQAVGLGRQSGNGIAKTRSIVDEESYNGKAIKIFRKDAMNHYEWERVFNGQLRRELNIKVAAKGYGQPNELMKGKSRPQDAPISAAGKLEKSTTLQTAGVPLLAKDLSQYNFKRPATANSKHGELAYGKENFGIGHSPNNAKTENNSANGKYDAQQCNGKEPKVGRRKNMFVGGSSQGDFNIHVNSITARGRKRRARLDISNHVKTTDKQNKEEGAMPQDDADAQECTRNLEGSSPVAEKTGCGMDEQSQKPPETAEVVKEDECHQDMNLEEVVVEKEERADVRSENMPDRSISTSPMPQDDADAQECTPNLEGSSPVAEEAGCDMDEQSQKPHETAEVVKEEECHQKMNLEEVVVEEEEKADVRSENMPESSTSISPMPQDDADAQECTPNLEGSSPVAEKTGCGMDEQSQKPPETAEVVKEEECHQNMNLEEVVVEEEERADERSENMPDRSISTSPMPQDDADAQECTPNLEGSSPVAEEAGCGMDEQSQKPHETAEVVKEEECHQDMNLEEVVVEEEERADVRSEDMPDSFTSTSLPTTRRFMLSGAETMTLKTEDASDLSEENGANYREEDSGGNVEPDYMQYAMYWYRF